LFSIHDERALRGYYGAAGAPVTPLCGVTAVAARSKYRTEVD
jgi:hypothetical protein